MTDRELLEAAAKAAGLQIYFDDVGQCCKHQPREPLSTFLWNPLTDDGDALRLAVQLKFEIIIGNLQTMVVRRGEAFSRIPYKKTDANVATRRAIVMAAVDLTK